MWITIYMTSPSHLKVNKEITTNWWGCTGKASGSYSLRSNCCLSSWSTPRMQLLSLVEASLLEARSSKWVLKKNPHMYYIYISNVSCLLYFTCVLYCPNVNDPGGKPVVTELCYPALKLNYPHIGKCNFYRIFARMFFFIFMSSLTWAFL